MGNRKTLALTIDIGKFDPQQFWFVSLNTKKTVTIKLKLNSLVFQNYTYNSLQKYWLSNYYSCLTLIPRTTLTPGRGKPNVNNVAHVLSFRSRQIAPLSHFSKKTTSIAYVAR